jgi:hypothetical protein
VSTAFQPTTPQSPLQSGLADIDFNLSPLLRDLEDDPEFEQSTAVMVSNVTSTRTQLEGNRQVLTTSQRVNVRRTPLPHVDTPCSQDAQSKT